ncbi:hypothetical protein D3C80_747470 [compost metagenome]
MDKEVENTVTNAINCLEIEILKTRNTDNILPTFGELRKKICLEKDYRPMKLSKPFTEEKSKDYCLFVLIRSCHCLTVIM